MAYVTAEMTKAVRVALKEQMPGWEIRVTKTDSTIFMKIDTAPKEFDLDLEFQDDDRRELGYMHINHYYIDHYLHNEQYSKILDIMLKATASVGRPFYNNSDAQIDYFDVAYYYYLSIGSCEKPYIKKENNVL